MVKKIDRENLVKSVDELFYNVTKLSNSPTDLIGLLSDIARQCDEWTRVLIMTVSQFIIIYSKGEIEKNEKKKQNKQDKKSIRKNNPT